MVVGRWNGKTMDLFVADQTQSKYTAPAKVVSAPSRKRASGQSTFYLGFGEDQPWLKGSLDEVMYFSRAITDAHIAELWLADPPAREMEEAAAPVQPAPATPAASSETASTPEPATSAPGPVAVTSKPKAKKKAAAKKKAPAKHRATKKKPKKKHRAKRPTPRRKH
jgi:hypothetical protein